MNEPEKMEQSSASNRIGEKIGWIGGWTGGFCWVLVFVIFRFIQGALVEALLGTAVFILAEVLIVMCAPWRHPTTRYYLLMLPIYGLFLAAVAWVIWSFVGLDRQGFNYWNLFWILPCLSPLITIGRKCWQDDTIPEK